MTLKRFKELEVQGSAEECRGFVEELTEVMSNGWRRAPELEGRVGGTAHLNAFECSATPDRRAVALWLAFREPRGLYVSNIVPKAAGQLSYNEYNAILDQFARDFAEPVAKRRKLLLTTSSGELHLDDVLSMDCFKALTDFSSSANKSTGSGHPVDAELWFQFLVLAHRDGWKLNSDDLGRWLKSEGWGDDRTFSLQVEYEQARELLRYYDASR